MNFSFLELKSAQEWPIGPKAGLSRPVFDAEYRYLIARVIQSTVAFEKTKKIVMVFSSKNEKK